MKLTCESDFVSYWTVTIEHPDSCAGVTCTFPKEEDPQVFLSEEEALQKLSTVKEPHAGSIVKCSRRTDALRFAAGQLNPNAGSFFAVFIPTECAEPCDENGGVFGSKSEADAFVKANKQRKPRFQRFSNFLDAEQFSIIGVSPGNQRPRTGPFGISPSGPSTAEGQPLPFDAPSRSDFVKLRKLVESDTVNEFRAIAEGNPRYLICSQSGDSPTLLHEGPRYNALILAARSGAHRCAEATLELVSDLNYIRRLYPSDSAAMIEERREILRRGYLNTPDKASEKTPLHWATKKGAGKIVEVLLEQQETNATVRDKNGDTVLHVAIEERNAQVFRLLLADGRVSDLLKSLKPELEKSLGSVRSPKDRNEISAILSGDLSPPTYYVALYRDYDYTIKPKIEVHHEPPPLSQDLRQMEGLVPVFLAAFAGPCVPETAHQFATDWQRKSRNREWANLTRSDLHKGMERLGQNLAKKYGLEWNEYWSFQKDSAGSSPSSEGGRYCDVSTPQGLHALESHLSSSRRKSKSASAALQGLSGSPYAPPLQLQGASARSGKSGRIKSRIDRWKQSPKKLVFDQNSEEDSVPHLSSDSNGAAASTADEPPEGERDQFEDSQDEFDDYLESDVSEVLNTSFETVNGSVTSELAKETLDLLLNTPKKSSAMDVSPREDPVDKKSENEHWDTPPATPPENVEFMSGHKPSKLDTDVLKAFDGAAASTSEFPNVRRWLNTVQFFSEEERKKWPSSDSVRYRDA